MYHSFPAGAIDTDKRHSHARFQDATVNRTNAELPARQNHFVSFSVSDAHNGEQSAAGHSESISVAFPTENPPIDMLSAVAGRPGDARYQLYVGEADNQQLAGKDNHVHGLHAHTVEQNLLQVVLLFFWYFLTMIPNTQFCSVVQVL